jgi:two-component system sensor histidine kinase AgrC
MNKEIFWTIFELTINIIESFIFLSFARTVLEVRVNKVKDIISFIISLFLLLLVENLYDYLGIFQNLFFFIVVFVYALVSLKSAIVNKIAVSIMPILIGNLINIPTIFWGSYILKVDTETIFTRSRERIIIIITTKIIFLLISFLVSHYIKKSNALNKKQWSAICLGFFAGDFANSLIVEYCSIHPAQKYESYIFGLLSLCICIMSFLIFFMITAFSRENQIRTDNILLKQEVSFQKQRIDMSKKSIEEFKQIKHDLKNYILLISGFIKNGDYSKAIEECNTIIKETDNTEKFIDCNSKMISIIINRNLQICKENFIDTKVALLGDFKGINEQDLSIIISDLLDNAIEYSLKVSREKRKITISIVNDNGYIKTVISNYIAESVLDDNHSMATSKKDAENHGIGHKSVQRLINRNSGIIQYREENQMFITTLILPKRSD